MSAQAALRIIENEDSADPLSARAIRLTKEYGGEDAINILRQAITEEFPRRIALVSSFGSEASVLLHLVAQVAPDTPVLFLDTGKHFAQTLSYKRKLVRELGLTDIRDLRPDTDDLAEKDAGGDLWRSDPDACCTARKVLPLEKALDGFDAWITGRKQFHGGGRVGLPVFEASAPFIKVNPIVRWSPQDVEEYAKRHNLTSHPLVSQGYPSIGCWPCTHPAAAGEDARAGRWRGGAKTECGIHELGARSVAVVG